MPDNLNVLITDPLADEGVQILTKAGLAVHRFPKAEGPGFEAACENADGWIIRSGTRLDKATLSIAKNLKVIGRAGVGVDNVDLEEAGHRGITVMNTPNVNTISVAEHTLGLIIALARNIPQSYSSLESGVWDRNRWVGTELYGKTLGIIGLGKIGAEVAKRAISFGMKIIGFDPFLDSQQIKALGVEAVELDSVYSESDIVTVHVPLNPKTRGLIGERELGLMKPSSFIINVARGGIIDEIALSTALKDHRIGGAAVDVYSSEPIDQSHPLIGVDNCILTPHLGASTRESKQRVSLEICVQMRDALLKKEFRNTV